MVFKAPLEGLWQSKAFIETFELPTSGTPLRECELNKYCICLEHVKVHEFRGFLKILLPV